MRLIPQWDEELGLTWKEKVAYLGYKFDQIPGPRAECPIEHIFAPGMYIREMRIPAAQLFLGRAHTYGHLCQLVSGSVIWITPNNKIEVNAPYQIHSEPGFHMVLYTITDIVGRTFHPNIIETRDTQLLEDTFFEPAAELAALGKSIHEQFLLRDAS